MTDIVITPASVLKGSNPVLGAGVAGVAITAGQTLYEDTAAANVLKLADANLSSLGATVVGIALHAAGTGQPIQYLKSGQITIGATLVAGAVYVNSATAGGIAPVADLASGWRTTYIGTAVSTTVLDVRIHNSDTAT